MNWLERKIISLQGTTYLLSVLSYDGTLVYKFEKEVAFGIYSLGIENSNHLSSNFPLRYFFFCFDFYLGFVFPGFIRWTQNNPCWLRKYVSSSASSSFVPLDLSRKTFPAMLKLSIRKKVGNFFPKIFLTSCTSR